MNECLSGLGGSLGGGGNLCAAMNPDERASEAGLHACFSSSHAQNTHSTSTRRLHCRLSLFLSSAQTDISALPLKTSREREFHFALALIAASSPSTSETRLYSNSPRPEARTAAVLLGVVGSPVLLCFTSLFLLHRTLFFHSFIFVAAWRSIALPPSFSFAPLRLAAGPSVVQHKRLSSTLALSSPLTLPSTHLTGPGYFAGTHS